MIGDSLTLPCTKTAGLPRMTILLASLDGMPYLPCQVASMMLSLGVV